MAESIDDVRERIEREYAHATLGSGAIGGTFGEVLCHEIHYGGEGHGLHFIRLAEKWHISVALLGDVIAHHCRLLQPPQKGSAESEQAALRTLRERVRVMGHELAKLGRRIGRQREVIAALKDIHDTYVAEVRECLEVSGDENEMEVIAKLKRSENADSAEKAKERG